MEPTDKEDKDESATPNGNGEKGIEISPIQLLGIILKCVLKEWITDEEIELICSNYYKTVKDWWG